MTPAALPEIGLTRKQAMEAKRLAAAGETAILAEARIGAELKAAQERGELATQDKHGRGVQSTSVPSGDTRMATLPEIGLTRKQAMEAKRLAAAGEPAILAEVQAATAERRRPSRRRLSGVLATIRERPPELVHLALWLRAGAAAGRLAVPSVRPLAASSSRSRQ